MALNVFKLFGQIAVDSSGAISGIDQTVGHAKKAEGNLSKTFKRIGGFVAAAFSVRAIVDFGKQCTQAYASISAEQSAFAQIMGDYADTAQKKLNAVSDATGITSTRMTGAMTSLTAKFKGLGYGVDDATTLASDGLLIAADAAAFWDMSLDESMSHLNSFINGSYEGGEAIGLFANDTQMAAYAIEKGIVADTKAWASLDEATKQATRLDYAKNMMEQSGAVGQAAKESKAYANVMANLKESWRQFQGVIGKPVLEKIVLPAMNALLKLMPSLTEAVQVGIDWLSAGFDKIASYFTEVFTEDGLNMEALPDALSNMFRDMGNAIPGLLRSLGRVIKGAWNNAVWPMIQGLFKAVFGIELPSWTDLTAQISDGWNNTVWPAIQDFFKKGFGIDMPDWNVLGAQIVSDWNTTLLPLITDVGKITLSLVEGDIQTAIDVAAPWFAKIISEAGDNLKLTLGILTLGTDENGKSWTDRITEWAQKMLPRAGALGVIVNLFLNDNAEDGTSWTDKVLNWAKEKMPANGMIGATVGLFTSWADEDGVPWTKKLVDWFKKMLPAAGVFGIIVSLLLNDNAEDGTSWKDKVLKWAKEKMPANGMIGATVGLFMNGTDADGVPWTKKLVDWFKKILPGTGVFGIIVSLLLNETDEEGNTWASKITDWFNGILTSVGDIFKKMFTIELPDASKIVADIKAWWNGIVSNVAMFLGINIGQSGGTADDGFYGPPAPASTGGGRNNRTVGGSVHADYRPTAAAFATGLDYVPRDNFLARLHQGEAVLTRSEADAWRNGYGGTSRLEALLAQTADILQDIAANTGAEKQVVLETGVLVGQLAPGLDAQLGMISNRKGRRN